MVIMEETSRDWNERQDIKSASRLPPTPSLLIRTFNKGSSMTSHSPTYNREGGPVSLAVIELGSFPLVEWGERPGWISFDALLDTGQKNRGCPAANNTPFLTLLDGAHFSAGLARTRGHAKLRRSSREEGSRSCYVLWSSFWSRPSCEAFQSARNSTGSSRPFHGTR